MLAKCMNSSCSASLRRIGANVEVRCPTPMGTLQATNSDYDAGLLLEMYKSEQSRTR
jgi:hypothetical protein